MNEFQKAPRTQEGHADCGQRSLGTWGLRRKHKHLHSMTFSRIFLEKSCSFLQGQLTIGSIWWRVKDEATGGIFGAIKNESLINNRDGTQRVTCLSPSCLIWNKWRQKMLPSGRAMVTAAQLEADAWQQGEIWLQDPP